MQRHLIRMCSRALFAIYVAYMICCPVRVHAQVFQIPPSMTVKSDGSQLHVYLMTIEAGTEIFEKFGHDALWIVDASQGQGFSYNYGIFDTTKPHFMVNFLRGRMLYSMGPYGPWAADYDVDRYTKENRTIWVQELNLTNAQKVELRDFLNENNLPEHMSYWYDYFRDNCTTRLRDALDKVLKGRIRATLEPVPSGVTYRWQARRLLSVSPAAYAGIELAMGHAVDKPLNQWENSFLPFELMNNLRHVQVPGPDGRPVPLVLSSRIQYQSTRPHMPLAPPDYRVAYTVIGILVGGLLFFLARLAVGRGSVGAARAFAVVGALWSLVVGFFGLVAHLLWFATDHVITRYNENILQANILSLVLAVVLLATLSGRGRVFALKLAYAIAGLSVLGFVLQILPGLDQFNGEIIGLVMPVHIGMALALRELSRGWPARKP